MDVLRSIDLTVPLGQKLAIIDPSGSGKTTLPRLVMILEKPDSGTIGVDGELVGARRVGDRLVPDDPKGAGHDACGGRRAGQGAPAGRTEGRRETSMTMLVVTHEITFARDISDRVIFMDGGRIVEDTGPEAMFTNATNERTRNLLSAVLDR